MLPLALEQWEEEEGDNRGYFYDSDRCGRNSDSPFSSDEEVDGLNDGADTPSKFAPRSSSKHMTELECGLPSVQLKPDLELRSST